MEQHCNASFLARPQPDSLIFSQIAVLFAPLRKCFLLHLNIFGVGCRAHLIILNASFMPARTLDLP